MKILACYSNKGGVGKTAAAVNLAYACAQSGRRTLLCDLDPQGASGFYFRIKPSRKLKEQALFRDVDRFLNAIRGSDFDLLDVMPANLTFRDFDIFLSRMKHRRSRLKKALKSVQHDYDVVCLDCPPNISLLSENVFNVADRILVPVIPTTLSERTYTQLLAFFTAQGFDHTKLLPFFSMIQRAKSLHKDTMKRMRKEHSRFLDAGIPFCSDVEKMGLHREPVAVYATTSRAARAYQELWQELETHL